MKKIMLFVLISALLATSMTSCKVEPKEDEVGEDEVGNDEVIEDEVTDDEVIEDEVTDDEVIEDEVIEDEVIEDEMVKESEAKTVDGIPKELYDTYGFSVIHPEKDDYSYIRINFDESREISGYAELGIGYAFGEDIGYIDSNGAFYSELPEGGKYSYLGDWQDAEVPDIEGVDAVAASPYGGNLLMFAKDGKYGYLNTDGEIVIEAQFYEARPFSDGLAAVCREYDGCLEYINESGETALKLEDANGYYNIFQMSDEEPSCDFSDGVALVYCGNEGFCIDKQGNRLNVKNPVGMHKQGRIAFYDEETKLYGFADKYGNIVIPAVYHGVFDFSQSGIALVKSTRNYNIPEEAQEFEVANYYRGYIDTEGNVVIPIEFEQPWWYYGTKGLIEPFESYGVVSLYKQGYIYYYRYDSTLLGKIPRMAYVRYEDESYKINVAEYWQWVNDGKDGASKEETEQPKYNVIYTPSDEMPTVQPEELIIFCDTDAWRYGYKTEAGEIIMPAIFRNTTVFFEGLAAVCRERNGPLEYIDASGKTILTVEGIDGANAIDYYGFQPSCVFNDGVAVIYDGGFCIDKTGNILNIKAPEGMYKCGLIAVRDPETHLIGYADIDGNIVIPGRYADVRDFEPQGVALVFSNELAMWPDGYETPYCGYINTKGEEIIPLEYYAGPNSGASIIHPIHREVDGMIELYKDGYYHYFAYDGTLVEKSPDPRPDSE